MYSDFNRDQDRATTAPSFDYRLRTDANHNPLERLGPQRELIFGAGYHEVLALLGDEHTLTIDQLSQPQQLIDHLTPYDLLGLQLYQNDDTGNQLFGLYGLPVVIAQPRPFALSRTHTLGQFNPGRSIPGLSANHPA